MTKNAETTTRRTGVESVFDSLYKEIVSMRLLPGAKISEAEIARRFDVSRQPVRDAFSRLANLDLILVRPQKATEVKRFSNLAITRARFVRFSVETEALRRAARLCTKAGGELLEQCIADQAKAVESADVAAFRSLDYEFHKALCAVGEVGYAFDVIASQKAQVDRLCVLGLKKDERLGQLLDDHIQIADRVASNDEQGAVDAGTLHLSRLDATIAHIQSEHADFFDS